MEMNDILSGLNSCDDNCCDNNNCCCGGMGSNPSLAGGLPYGGLGGFGGCGLGSWIWILLILFYCGGCGYGNNGCGNNGCGNNCCMNNCCCDNDCCCCGNNNANNNCGLLGGNCSCYLFLLVVLFLCNGYGGNGFLGGFGNCGGCGQGYGMPQVSNGMNCCDSNCGC